MKRIVGWALALACLMGAYSCGGAKKSQSTQGQAQETDSQQYITLKVRHEPIDGESAEEDPTSKFAPLFKTKNKYISYRYEGHDEAMKGDFNGDGKADETLMFVPDERVDSLPKGLLYLRGEVSQNFRADLQEALDQLGESSSEFIDLEMTYHDFDKDNIPELVVSLVDMGSLFMNTRVYRWTNKDTKAPWEYVASIYGQTRMYIDPNGDVVAPFGSQGLFYAYRFDGKTFAEVESSFDDQE